MRDDPEDVGSFIFRSFSSDKIFILLYLFAAPKNRTNLFLVCTVKPQATEKRK